jgi:NADH-quinone oxidoreductase subunit N
MLNSIISILPEILMVIFGLILLVIDVITKDENKAGVGYFGIAFILFTLVASIPSPGMKIFGFGNSLVWDGYSYAFFFVFAIAYVLSTLNSIDYLKKQNCNKGEFYLIMFFSIVGMMFMVSATELSVFYVGLETMAISMYILAGFNKANKASNEAGVKYFIIGAFSSGLLLYGMTYIYGYTGSLNYYEIAEMIKQNGAVSFNLKLGIVLMLSGFAFKVSAVPFHMWAPDVYSGAPTSATGFMTVAPKAAAFGALIRFVWVALDPAAAQWELFFSILAVLTMTYGNLVALAQKNVKRMLAYSAISHAGYGLMAVVAHNQVGYQAIALYMMIYGFMNIGAFTVLATLKSKGIIEDESLESFKGLSKKYPMASLAMLLFLFSLAGVPPLAGFIGKFQIFSAVISSKIYWLAIVGVLNSVVASYYYLRVTIYMYFKEPEEEVVSEMKPAAFVGILISSVAVVLIGIFPNFFINIIKSMII